MKNKYFLTAVCMYLNYIVIGVSVIILSMNMDALMKQFGTDRTGFGLVVSGIGIGKFIVLFISGVLSDKFGRKPFILIGMVGFIVYFMGILLSPNVPIALFFAVLAGMCNSFIDAGTYPALMEIFPTSAGTANLAIKFFSAAGQFIMPFIFSFIIQKNLNYSLSFYIVIGYLVLNIVFMFTRGFPALSTQSGAAEKEVKRTFYEKPKMAIEGVCLILMGFTSTTIFTVVQVWMAKVAEEYAGMSVAAASKMLTYFSLGVGYWCLRYGLSSKRSCSPDRYLFDLSIDHDGLFDRVNDCSITALVFYHRDGDRLYQRHVAIRIDHNG